jgi:hypothetical protein
VEGEVPLVALDHHGGADDPGVGVREAEVAAAPGDRHAVQQLFPPAPAGRVLLLGAPELVLHDAQLLQLLRGRLSLRPRLGAQLGDARLELAPACVHGQQFVEQLRCALARECGPEALGLVARGSNVDHARKCK